MIKIIKQGFELFSVRNNIVDLSKYQLPPIYKLFVNTFLISRNEKLKSVFYLDRRYNEKLGVARLKYLPNPDHIKFGTFFSPEESNEIMSFAFDLEDTKILEGKYKIIGEDGTGHYFFMVGVGDENLDQIFIESSDRSFPGGKRFTKIADNIFDFVKELALVEIEDGIGYGVVYSQLYKNWGEDFWRVREKE